MPVKNRFAELHDEITGWRRHIHENPEIAFEETETAAFVVERLNEIGVDEVVTGLGKTGVVAVIKGRSDTKGKVIGIRADMDALPMSEDTGLDYASKNPGAMHACGHDGHTAMLLGAAKYLSETRNFDGTAVLIFQPAEEGGGGADVMCQDGLMSRWDIDEVYSMHNWPGRPVGEFSIRAGAFFAATDTFDIHFEGRGGHGAKPQDTVDTTVMAAQAVLALQTIASRNADPVDHVVVSVTSFETGSNAFNVIPQKVHLKGTVRTLSKEMRALAEERMKAICEGIAATFGGSVVVDYHRGYPSMVNHEEQTAFAADVARKISGDCGDAPLVMGGEDFAYMLEERPGAYILVGNGDTANVHHPKYNFNDETIPAGCSWYAEVIEQRMPVG